MPSLTPEIIVTALGTFGPVRAPPAWRWWRWFAEVDDERVAFVAEDDEAWARLIREEELLGRLAGNVSFAVPEIVACRRSVRRSPPSPSMPTLRPAA
jgi:hypothetical protein